ncbi:putative ribonuclease H-like domain-containing protein [Tanacetum coccineum]
MKIPFNQEGENLEEEPAPTTGETSVAPKTAKQLVVRRNQERVKSILLLAIPDEYLLKFYICCDAKSLWVANQIEIWFWSLGDKLVLDSINDKSLGGSWLPNSKEDIIQKFLSKKVYEDELKRSSGSNYASQNLAFLSSKNTGSTNEVSTAVEILGLMDRDDLEELDLRWQVAMLTVRIWKESRKRLYGKQWEEKCTKQMIFIMALVAQDVLEGYDWSSMDFDLEPVNYAFDGNFLTPRADISFVGLDEYAIRNKIIESKTTELNNKTSETAGKTNDANTEKPKSVSESVVSNPKINRDSVIIEDWTSDDVEEVPSINTARPVTTARPSINTARLVSTASPSISIARHGYASRPIYPRMDNVKPKGSCLPIKRSYYTKPTFRPKDLKQDVKTFGVKNMTTARKRVVVNTGKGKLNTDLKKSRWVWRPKENYMDHVSKDSGSFMIQEILLQDHAVVDSGCSSHMTGNKAYLSDYEDFNGGFVAFGTLEEVMLYIELQKDDVYRLDLLKLFLFWRCDNGTEFKNYAMNEFCAKKGIKREFSVARTPQQNGVSERKNRTLIEAAKTIESMKMNEKSTDFVTPTKALGEAQEEDISPTILEAAKTLSKVASQGVSKVKSTDKGKRYRRRARSVAKNINTGLDAEEEINTGIEEVSTGSAKVDSGTASKRGQREGKAPMVEEDIQATHKTKEQIRQEEAGLEEAIRLQAQMIIKGLEASQLKKLSFEEIKEEFDKLVQRIDTFVSMDFEATKAKRNVAEVKEEEPTKKKGKRKKQKARKYRKHPLSKDAYQVMLKMKLLDGTMDEVCYKLLKMIEKQAGIRK